MLWPSVSPQLKKRPKNYSQKMKDQVFSRILFALCKPFLLICPKGTPTPALNDDIQRRSSSSSTIKNTDHSSHLIRSNNNTNNMSVSVPNLSLNTINVNDSTVGLLDAFASAARRRTHSNQQNSTNATNNANAGNSLLSRGSTNVCSLVRLALSSNFPGNLPGMTPDYSFCRLFTNLILM